jgi:hypothetical protein
MRITVGTGFEQVISSEVDCLVDIDTRFLVGVTAREHRNVVHICTVCDEGSH